jgi:hypothetical protein
MAQKLFAGDYLVFQLESGYGLLRVLAIDEKEGDTTWHLAAFDDFFIEVEQAERAIDAKPPIGASLAHIALTNRAFESTQVARLVNKPITEDDKAEYIRWLERPNREISDRSIRLMLGLR